MKKWIYIRCALIAINVFATVWSGPLSGHATSAIRPVDLVIGFFFGLLGLQCVLGIQSINKRSAQIWKEPSWRENPFSLKQPVQFFHFAAWFLIVPSFLSSGLTALYKPGNILDALMPVSFGIGILGGVHLSKKIFREKFGTVY